MTVRKLIRDESTSEKRAWWKAIERAAKNAPRLGKRARPSGRHKGWVLVSPLGRIISGTFAECKDDVCTRAFDYLYKRYPWAHLFWKNWDGFIEERNRRGWWVVRAEVHLSSPIAAHKIPNQSKARKNYPAGGH